MIQHRAVTDFRKRFIVFFEGFMEFLILILYVYGIKESFELIFLIVN